MICCPLPAISPTLCTIAPAMTCDLPPPPVCRHSDELCRNIKATQEPRFASVRQTPRAHSQSQAEPLRRQHHSHSPHTDALPSCREGYTCDSSRRVKRDKPEVFQSGTGSRGRVCAVCLGRHEHFFAKCEETRLWNGSAAAAQKNKQGHFAAVNSQHLCFDWQLPRGCASTSHTDRHICSGCGSSDHGAQSCPLAEKA